MKEATTMEQRLAVPRTQMRRDLATMVARGWVTRSTGVGVMVMLRKLASKIPETERLRTPIMATGRAKQRAPMM